MKINSVNNQNFGKLYASDEQLADIQANGYKVLNPIIDNYDVLLSYQKLIKSKTKHIFINKDNDVYIINETLKTPLRIGKHSDSLLKKLKVALRWLYKEQNDKTDIN